jgi:predicted ATPase/DNA-binding CsgD family transcriptional regulator
VWGLVWLVGADEVTDVALGMTANKDTENPGRADSVVGNLPVRLTRVVGREQALAELSSVLWRTRLLSLCGPGGNGKTRLAVALAEAVREDFVGGAWWADLSSVFDPGLVGQAVASAVYPGAPAGDPGAALAQLFTESSLLVLDNCEQVAEACARFVARMLERSPSLRVVVTSRQPLRVPGEHVWRVPGLSAGAADLFAERAADAASDFDRGAPGVGQAIERICVALDGMPLAIELAAARAAVLGCEQIADRLEQGLAVLGRGSRTAPTRHQTLEATLEWSHQLLEEDERQLFRRLAAFRGSFSLAAAETICAHGSVGSDDVLDLLGALVDQSLVGVERDGGEPRYRLLNPIRGYAIERLDECEEAGVIRDRHAALFTALAAAGGDGAGDQLRWLELLESEHDNLNRALVWQLAHASGEAARLAGNLWPFWYRRGYYAEARDWFEQTLAASAEMTTDERVGTLLRLGAVAFLQCDYAVATGQLEAALELIDQSRDPRLAARALQRLGSIAREQGRYDTARELHERSRAIWESLGESAGVASSDNFLGFVAWLAGDASTGVALCSRALVAFTASGDLSSTTSALINLGASALYAGEPDSAGEHLERALALARRIGFQEGIAWALHELAIVGRYQHRAVRHAAPLLREALVVHRRLGDRWRAASVLEEIATSVLARTDPRAAVGLLGAAETLRAQLGVPIPHAERPDRDDAVERLRRKLSAATFSACWAEGMTRDLDLLIPEVVTALEAVPGEAGRAGDLRQLAPTLTSRELAVLELLSEGRTNSEIAAALFISTSTAGVHLSNILRKLGARRRVDAAGLAHQLGLLSVG